MGFIHKFIYRTRTLQVSILSLFLSLTIVAFAAIITFTYSRNYKQILVSSKQVAERVDQVILEKFRSIANGAERITEVTAGLYFNLGEISVQNDFLKSYILNVLKFDTQFSNFYIGLSNGGFYGILNLKTSSQSTFIGDETRLLPPEVLYAIKYVDCSSDPTTDTWYYLDSEFKLVVSQTLSPAPYDTVNRPWYKGAVKNRGLYWTDFYAFSPTKEKGISVSTPVFDKEGNIVAVVAADLTFVQLALFLKQQVIGKTGKAYMVDNNGAIIIPHLDGDKGSHSESLVSEVMKWYDKNPQRPDFVFTQEGVEYLAYVGKVPFISGRDWRIVMIAPLKDFFAEMIKMQRDVILIIVGILIVSSLIIIYFSKKISAPIVILANEVNKIRQLELDSEVRVKSNIKEIFLIDASIAAMRRALRSFARYVPKEVVKDLFQKGEDINLGGEKKEITIFFSDVAGFTTIAEALPIDVLIPLLSEYFDVITKIIQESHGTVDKFMGDGIMAFWGAPLDLPDHAVRACICALECNAKMIKFNQKRLQEGKPEFRTRFGINTGTVIVGNFGTSDRMNYTVIGDAVNLTARLQEVDKFYHTTIIISEDVYKKVGDQFLVRPLDVVNVKGKKAKVKIYELIAKMQGNGEVVATKEQIELCAAFTEAYETYMLKDYKKARELFLVIQQRYPNDFPTKIHLDRIDEESSKKLL